MNMMNTAGRLLALIMTVLLAAKRTATKRTT